MKVPPHRFVISQNIEALLYNDNRPNRMEIADLQKGLVLELESKEIIEEGIGFGAPVVIYGDDVFFSKTARIVNVGPENITKIFQMDSISRVDFQGIIFGGFFYKKFYDIFSRHYMETNWSQAFFRMLMALKRSLGFRTRFIAVENRGSVRVKFKFIPSKILVNVDLTGLRTSGCKEILLLNEQGARSFNRYSDSSGTEQNVSQMGAWEEVKSKSATLEGVGVKFTIYQQHGVKLMRGREEVLGRLSWIGFAYSLQPSITEFDYAIQIGRN
ncbi:MAG: hypothetical protein O7B32_03745 [Thaumarchaeota archaeon]|nr:hypothetical protein [Nitrososphaerota archaeon]